MTVLRGLGDEVQGERIVCFYRKRDREILVHLTKGHRGWRLTLHGLPARCVIEREVDFARSSAETDEPDAAGSARSRS